MRIEGFRIDTYLFMNLESALNHSFYEAKKQMGEDIAFSEDGKYERINDGYFQWCDFSCEVDEVFLNLDRDLVLNQSFSD